MQLTSSDFEISHTTKLLKLVKDVRFNVKVLKLPKR